MYKDPKTKEVVLTHPAELQRIPDFRDHGFDELNPIHQWLIAKLEKQNGSSFYQTLDDADDTKAAENYIFVKCEKNVADTIPHYMVEIEAGYIDFQDSEQVPVSSINLVLYEKSKLITLISASSHGSVTEDVVRSLSDLVDGPYLKFS